MKFIYLTSKNYPGKTADHSFVKKQAEAFAKALGPDFIFVANGLVKGKLQENVYNPFLNIKRGKIILYSLWFPFFYLKFRKDKNIIFFSNDAYLLSIIIFWKKIFSLKYKVVSDWHQLFQDWRDNFVAKNSDYLITTTEVLKNKIVNEINIDSEKIKTVYGGVDLNLFNSVSSDKKLLRNELDLPRDKKLIGYVGYFKTMGMDKGVGDLIKSLKFLNDEFRVVLVGGKDNEEKEYKDLSKKENVLDRCIFIDRQEGEDLIKYEKSMDVLVIPYPNKKHFREWGFPMKTYEYMASGVPIIYSDLRILNEVLNGLAISFKAESSEDLAEEISNIGEKYVSRAKDKVVNYTWDKRVDNVINFVSK